MSIHCGTVSAPTRSPGMASSSTLLLFLLAYLEFHSLLPCGDQSHRGPAGIRSATDPVPTGWLGSYWFSPYFFTSSILPFFTQWESAVRSSDCIGWSWFCGLFLRHWKCCGRRAPHRQPIPGQSNNSVERTLNWGQKSVDIIQLERQNS